MMHGNSAVELKQILEGETPARQGGIRDLRLPWPSRELRGRQWLRWGLAGMLALSTSAAAAQSGIEANGAFPGNVGRAAVVASEKLGGSAEAASLEIQLKALDTATSAPVVTALAASPDGNYLAVAGDDHAIRILDAASGEELQVVIGHSDWVRCLAFREQSGGQPPLLYSAGDDGLVLEWTFVQPLQSREVIRLPFAVRSLDVSADQQLLAFGGFSTDVLVWDIAGELLLQRLRCPSGDIQAVAFSGDSQQVACGGRGGEVTVWDARSGQQLVHHAVHRRRVRSICFSADGAQLTSVGEDRRLVRMDWNTGQIRAERELGRTKLQALCMLAENTLATAGADNRIGLYDLASDRVVGELEGHWGTVAVLVPCGKKLVSGSFDTTVRIWDLEKVGRQPGSVGLPVTTPVQMDTNWQIR